MLFYIEKTFASISLIFKLKLKKKNTTMNKIFRSEDLKYKIFYMSATQENIHSY